MASDYDILSVLGNKSYAADFKVTFDIYTPRAHVIILAKDSSLNDITQLSAKKRKELVETALLTKRMLKLNEASLSVHRGSWVTSRHFHVHVCTGVGEYLEIFNHFSRMAPMRDWWPAKHFVNRQWKISSDPRKYADNVRGYPVRGYKEKISIDEFKRCPGMTSYKYDGANYALIFHGNRRRIGIHGNPPADAAATCKLLDLLDQLARDIGAKTGQEGCQVIVDLTGRGFPGFPRPVYGYLEVSGTIFCTICPPELRAAWARAYTALPEDKIYT